MIYAYVRVSMEKQSVENQRYQLLAFAHEKQWLIDQWVEESISSRKKLQDRELSGLLETLQPGDIVLVSELSRLGRSLLEVMSILYTLMEKEIQVYTVKERYELGNTISSKVLAFAFGLAAEIERDLISLRTRDALARKKSEGVRLGRPPGARSKVSKLTGKEPYVNELLDNGVSQRAIARILGVDRETVGRYAAARKL